MRTILAKVIPWFLGLLGALTMLLAIVLGTQLGTWVDEHSSQAVTDSFPSFVPIIMLAVVGVLELVLGWVAGGLTLNLVEQPIEDRGVTTSSAL